MFFFFRTYRNITFSWCKTKWVRIHSKTPGYLESSKTRSQHQTWRESGGMLLEKACPEKERNQTAGTKSMKCVITAAMKAIEYDDR